MPHADRALPGADIIGMTDTETLPTGRGVWLKRIGVGVLAILVIIGLFLASNALTLAWQARESLRNQIRADVRAAVAAIKDQPLGTSTFTIVNAANDYAVGYDYSYLQMGAATNIVPVKHNQAVDRILILPLTGELKNLDGALNSGSEVRGYRVVGVSLNDSVANFAYTYNSKTAAYADASFDAATLGSGRFDTKQATLVYDQQPGQERLTVSTVATLSKAGKVNVSGVGLLSNLTPEMYARRAARLTAFGLKDEQVALYDRDGKPVKVPNAKWDATYIIAAAPQESSIQFSTPVATSLDPATLAKLSDGGQLRVSYRGLTMQLTFAERTFKQVFKTASTPAPTS
jgi:hypothetical protein